MTVRLLALASPPSLEAQPEVVLERWALFELPTGTRHFCGYDPDPGKPGRVSSPIHRFDPATMTGITRSGRVYWLKGARGGDEETSVLMAPWLLLNGFDLGNATAVETEAFGQPVH